MEPLSVAVHAIANVGGLRTGETVLIFGAGPVGLLAMGVAKGLGAKKIIAVDINEERLNFAKSYAATHTYIPASLSHAPARFIELIVQIKQEEGEPRPEYSVRAAADLLLKTGTSVRGLGAIDLVMDATGAETCIQIGLNAVKPG